MNRWLPKNQVSVKMRYKYIKNYPISGVADFYLNSFILFRIFEYFQTSSVITESTQPLPNFLYKIAMVDYSWNRNP